MSDSNRVLFEIPDEADAFTFSPEHGFSLFLAKRTKTIHFVRHAEGMHNAANREAGDDTPVTYSTPGAWKYQDAKLTEAGIQQCLKVRREELVNVHPELIVVSPFTRTLQTAHILFGGESTGAPFLVHDDCGERRGKFTCDKRRHKTIIVQEIKPLYDYTADVIDFESFAYATESDELWTKEREPDDSVTSRAIAMLQWLATRPEKEIAVVTHSSWLRHLFLSFGEQTVQKDRTQLQRSSGNAEIRSITLAMHKGFYPNGNWERDGETEVFVPDHHSFRRGKYGPSDTRISGLHERLVADRPGLKEHASMPY